MLALSADKRTVRSFVRRTGRMTPAQERALESLWPRYGVRNSSTILDFNSLYGRDAPVVLEIGFGNGESLVEQARQHPHLNYLGIDVHMPGVGHCLLQAEKERIPNLRLIAQDAIDVLQSRIGDGALQRINLYFPDPWPKKRHHKRRIIQGEFLHLVARRLCQAGEFFIATDWADYARHIDEILVLNPYFEVVERREHAADAPLDRVTTKFERRGRGKGHAIRDWHLRSISAA